MPGCNRRRWGANTILNSVINLVDRRYLELSLEKKINIHLNFDFVCLVFIKAGGTLNAKHLIAKTFGPSLVQI